MRLVWIPPLLALAWGLNWPAVKIMLSALPPFTARGLGLGLGALLLLGLAVVQRKALWPRRQAWPFVGLGGVLTVAVFNVCTAFAQLSTSTSRAAVLTFTMPMISAVLGWLLLGERPGRRGGLALAWGGLGIVVLAWPVLSRLGGASAPPLRGLLLPLCAALAWALGTVASKRWPPVGDRMVLTAWQLLLGALITSALALLSHEQLPEVWPTRVVLALSYHVLIATAVAYVLWYRLLSELSATVSSLTTLAVPVVGVLGAMVLVGDQPSASDWLGFALVLCGAALAVLRLQTPAQAAVVPPHQT